MTNRVTCGDRLELLRGLPSESVSFVITRAPERLLGQWPAIFAEVVRIMKPGAFCVSYALAKPVVPMMDAWLAAGLMGRSAFAWGALSKGVVVGVFSKGKYRNRRSVPNLPGAAELPTGRTERMLAFIAPLVERYSKARQLVLDPFADEAVCVSIPSLNRRYILIGDKGELSHEVETLNAHD